MEDFRKKVTPDNETKTVDIRVNQLQKLDTMYIQIFTQSPRWRM